MKYLRYFNMDAKSMTVFQSLMCYIVFIGYFVVCKTSDVSKEGLTLTVEHAVGTGSALDFRERGHITIKSTKGIIGYYKDNDELASKEFQNLLKEATYKGNFYHIRIAVQPLESEESDVPYYLSTFIKACSLPQSNFSDIIKLNVDHTVRFSSSDAWERVGQIFAVGLSTTTADCSDIHSNQIDLMDREQFNTTVILSHVTPGPVPETQTYIKKLEDERRGKERGKGKDNRSFLAKYWMYIVPLVIFLLLSGQESPAGGATAAGGSGGTN